MRLITVAVITYNSTKTIIDALESVKNQTYPNIELIVSDDCSSDNTVDIIKSWMKENKHLFTNTKLLLSDTNTGIAPNLNRSIAQSNGEWIRFLAGDDMLTPNSIESYAKIIKDGMHFIMGNLYVLSGKNEIREQVIDTNFFQLDSVQQLAHKKMTSEIAAVGLIFNKKSLLSVNGFDERFPMMEDIPFFVKVLEAGMKFDGLNEFVCIYRKHEGSVQHSPKFHLSHVNYVRHVVVPRYKEEKRYIDYWHDKLWSKKEILKIENRKIQSYLIYLIMLCSDIKEWISIVRHKLYRPLIFKYRVLRKK
ncbi:glycosyltransferase [Bacteroidales bacterium OttesenSCG-928-A17]|nr:glycosyltransferase [Bacteroidales bacterium OttesenSCG-928-A17]